VGLNLVRATYWLGAIVDVLAGVQLLLPSSVTILGFPGLRLPGAAGYPAVIAAVLMFGFSAILIWAHLRTVERRRVLVLTLIVIVALAVANLLYGVTGALPWAQLVGPLGIQAVLSVLFAVSYAVATREAERRASVTAPREADDAGSTSASTRPGAHEVASGQ
jgi:hypothetical protein